MLFFYIIGTILHNHKDFFKKNRFTNDKTKLSLDLRSQTPNLL